jgi:hypothetical protein
MTNASNLRCSIACFRHALGRQRVIDQELHRFDAAWIGRVAIEFLEKTRHSQWVVAGFRHGADADPVGFELIGARVVDLVLDRGALSREHGALRPGRAMRRRAQENRGQHGSRGHQTGVTLVDEPPDEMPLRDVRGLVRHHAGQLILIARGEDQAAVNGYEPSGHGKRVDDGIPHHEVEELMLSFLGAARQRMAYFLDVVADLRVFQHHPALIHLAEPAEAGAVFVLERHRRIGGAAQIRQVLIRRAEACRPAHTHACPQNQSRGKGSKWRPTFHTVYIDLDLECRSPDKVLPAGGPQRGSGAQSTSEA